MIISCCIVHSVEPLVFEGEQLIFHELATDSKRGPIKIKKGKTVSVDKLNLLDILLIKRFHRGVVTSLNQLGVKGFETIS